MKRRQSQLRFKEMALAMVGTAVLGFALITPHSASAVDLRHHSVITGSKITVGDLFSGLDGDIMERKANRVLGMAPRPGQDMVLNARTLMRIAIALDLPWRPHSGADQVVLSRAATVIGREMIEDTLKDELTLQGLNGAFNLIFPSSMAEIILPHDQPQSVVIGSLTFRPDQNRFEATLVAPSRDNQIQKLVVHGTIQRLVQVPVLRETLRNGDVIGARDLNYVEVPQQRLKHNVILDARDLIGMTPRRVLFTDKPVKTQDIEAPRIVSRGENVTMIFKHGGMVLTAQGKAMEFGAKGDAIRVTNLSSSKTVEAIVSGVKEVTIRSF